MHQTAMTGDDWLSDQQRKAAAKAQQRKRKAGAAAAKKCREAADAIQAFMHACGKANDGSGVKRSDDQRLIFVRDLRDYVAFLEQRYVA